jgi:tetratricopeptide (TPR) repeat protein
MAAPALAGSGFLRSVEAAKREARQSDRLIFVDLFADWCGWCHRFEKEVVPAEKFQKATRNMVLLRVDTEDGKEGTQLAREFGITTLPTFLLLTPDMLVAGIIRGYAPADPFAEQLNNLEKEFREFEKRVTAEASLARDPEKRLELAKEFLNRQGFSQAETRLQSLLGERSLPPAVRESAFYHLALAQLSQNRHDQASATLKKLFAFQAKGETVEQGRFLLGQIYLDQKNYQAALAEFRRFKTLFPSSPLVKNVDFLIPQLESAIARAQ